MGNPRVKYSTEKEKERGVKETMLSLLLLLVLILALYNNYNLYKTSSTKPGEPIKTMEAGREIPMLWWLLMINLLDLKISMMKNWLCMIQQSEHTEPILQENKPTTSINTSLLKLGNKQNI